MNHSDAVETDDTVAQLQSYGACDIADALLRLNHPNAGFLPGLTLRAPSHDSQVIGRAYTVQWKTFTPGGPQEKNYTGHYIDQVPSSSILFISSPPLSQCVLGGLMALRLSKIGAKGAIIDGRIRDLAELRSTGLPVFARNVGISAANAVAYAAQINVPVRVEVEGSEGITIDPGDILVGDENGVAHIPRRLEKEVLELLPKLREQDEKVREAIEGGSSATQAFKLRTIK